MGWLGYFIGMNEQLTGLHLTSFTPTSGASVMDVFKSFFMGVNNNKSIHKLSFDSMDLLSGRVFSMMGPFFENSCNFAELRLYDCHLGDEGWRLLALAIGSSKTKSLQILSLKTCSISDEGSVDIITALSMHPNLQHLWWTENRLGKNGCTALATLLKYSATKLQFLDLGENEIDDEGIDALVPALKNCSLPALRLENNLQTTIRGWRCLATVLGAPTSKLKRLYIVGNNIDDQVLTVFARLLVNNRTLTSLCIRNHSTPLFTEHGLAAISNLLCNTSSVNSTFLSNHTINYLGDGPANQNLLQPLTRLNKRKDKQEVAMIKILQHHNDFDMTPFFEWEFKILPLMIDWFERAAAITKLPINFQPNIGPRKLSSVYQFVRGMPLLYVETRLRKELEDIKASESQMEEEQFLLRQEQLKLDLKLQRLRQRKQSVKDQKESLLEKLAR